MNSYYQIELKNDGTYLIIHNATDNGSPIDFNELSDYLSDKNISFDISSLKKSILAAQNLDSVKVNSYSKYEEAEDMAVKISDDHRFVSVRFYPPSTKGNLLSKQDIVNSLNIKGIVYGIDEELIDNLLINKEYCTDYIIAKALLPVNGKDAYIDYCFNIDLSAKPAVNEDGSVDFFNLNTVNHINEGDILAELHREVPGTDGIDVFGEPIKCRDVKSTVLKIGKNISLNEDKTKAYSEVSGHVTLVDDTIFVSNVYEVNNVDSSTGDINYDGSVKILGNVNSNFTVTAKGDIEVSGVVEGATLNADGNVIIARGINGMGKGVVNAKGNIIVKYVENATLISAGYIQTEAIMHSKVMAMNEVIVDGKKGNVAGSYVSARDKICVKSLGSQMGTDTVVQLGIDVFQKKYIEDLRLKIMEDSKTLSQIIPIRNALHEKLNKGVTLLDMQLDKLNLLDEQFIILSNSIENSQDKLDELESFSVNECVSFLSVKDVVFSGTKICINDCSLTTKSDYKYCKFILDNSEIKMVSL